jgi:hypothetical protein
MENFSNASFSPDVIKVLSEAMENAVATLPEPVSTAHVHAIAESILRAGKDGLRDVATLQRLALLELQIMPRD